MPKCDVYPQEYFQLKEDIRKLKVTLRNTLSRIDRAYDSGKMEKFQKDTQLANDLQAELFIKNERIKQIDEEFAETYLNYSRKRQIEQSKQSVKKRSEYYKQYRETHQEYYANYRQKLRDEKAKNKQVESQIQIEKSSSEQNSNQIVVLEVIDELTNLSSVNGNEILE